MSFSYFRIIKAIFSVIQTLLEITVVHSANIKFYGRSIPLTQSLFLLASIHTTIKFLKITVRGFIML